MQFIPSSTISNLNSDLRGASQWATDYATNACLEYLFVTFETLHAGAAYMLFVKISKAQKIIFKVFRTWKNKENLLFDHFLTR